jgi:hypothetical protein
MISLAVVSRAYAALSCAACITCCSLKRLYAIIGFFLLEHGLKEVLL